jgi:hypothetical protein
MTVPFGAMIRELDCGGMSDLFLAGEVPTRS